MGVLRTYSCWWTLNYTGMTFTLGFWIISKMLPCSHDKTKGFGDGGISMIRTFRSLHECNSICVAGMWDQAEWLLIHWANYMQLHCSESVSEQMLGVVKSYTILIILNFSLQKWFLMMYILNVQTSNNIATNLIMPSCRSEFLLPNDV